MKYLGRSAFWKSGNGVAFAQSERDERDSSDSEPSVSVFRSRTSSRSSSHSPSPGISPRDGGRLELPRNSTEYTIGKSSSNKDDAVSTSSVGSDAVRCVFSKPPEPLDVDVIYGRDARRIGGRYCLWDMRWKRWWRWECAENEVRKVFLVEVDEDRTCGVWDKWIEAESTLEVVMPPAPEILVPSRRTQWHPRPESHHKASPPGTAAAIPSPDSPHLFVGVPPPSPSGTVPPPLPVSFPITPPLPTTSRRNQAQLSAQNPSPPLSPHGATSPPLLPSTSSLHGPSSPSILSRSRIHGASPGSTPPSSHSRNSSQHEFPPQLQGAASPRNDMGSLPSTPRATVEWQKMEEIGRGTFGTVYRCLNEQTNEIFAMKEVRKKNDPDSLECLRQLKAEIELLGRLRHPNIVRYLGCQEDENHLYIFLEYMRWSMKTHLKPLKQPPAEDVIRKYTFQILKGLEYLHRQNTVHRDIKSSNLLVDSSGIVKLADFGLAKQIQHETDMTAGRGTIWWMAPEVINTSSGAGYERPVDIWSLGCTVIEMATLLTPWFDPETRQPPWGEPNQMTAMLNIGGGKKTPMIPRNLSRDGQDFISQCLRLDPSTRPSAQALLQHPFVSDLHESSNSAGGYQDNPEVHDGSIRGRSRNPVYSDGGPFYDSSHHSHGQGGYFEMQFRNYPHARSPPRTHGNFDSTMPLPYVPQPSHAASPPPGNSWNPNYFPGSSQRPPTHFQLSYDLGGMSPSREGRRISPGRQGPVVESMMGQEREREEERGNERPWDIPLSPLNGPDSSSSSHRGGYWNTGMYDGPSTSNFRPAPPPYARDGSSGSSHLPPFGWHGGPSPMSSGGVDGSPYSSPTRQYDMVSSGEGWSGEVGVRQDRDRKVKYLQDEELNSPSSQQWHALPSSDHFPNVSSQISPLHFAPGNPASSPGTHSPFGPHPAYAPPHHLPPPTLGAIGSGNSRDESSAQSTMLPLSDVGRVSSENSPSVGFQARNRTSPERPKSSGVMGSSTLPPRLQMRVNPPMPDPFDLPSSRPLPVASRCCEPVLWAGQIPEDYLSHRLKNESVNGRSLGLASGDTPSPAIIKS